MARKRKGEGQTALVTGASGGIGLDLAECFAKDGYNLILVARSEPALKQEAARLAQKYNVTTTAIASDLGVQGAGHKLADDIRARGLAVDVLVNNAGYGIAGAFDSSKESDQLGMIDLNVRALVELTHAFWPFMLANKRGGVLNVASTAAFQPGPLMAIYYASKAFVLSFSEALWREAQGTGVQVSCLCPGPTASKFRERAGTGATRLSTLGTPVTSMSVAKAGYRAFQKNQRVLITGFRNRALARLVPYLPRTTILNIAHRLQSPI
ncbi:MAG: SDR family oxidoreductase [Proteobacteria bacterium]|nr:SDR family oxidoreductase [Pseudomonadota bacterium]